MSKEKSPYVLVENEVHLSRIAMELKKQGEIGVDLEANSMFRYQERVCLIQISTVRKDYIIDPLTLKDISPLEKIFADPKIEKILHAASNDIAGFKRDYQFFFRNVFDTALAAKLLGHKKLGLATLLNEYFGVYLNKR